MPFDISGETMSNQRIVLDQDVVVTHLQGKMYLVAADGSQRLVAEGDVLPKDAVLLAPEGASFQGGETTFTLGSGERPEQGDAVLANAGTPDDIAALQQAILDGTDPTKAFEASAAGGAPAAGNAGGGLVPAATAVSSLSIVPVMQPSPAQALTVRTRLARRRWWMRKAARMSWSTSPLPLSPSLPPTTPTIGRRP
ncbi:retention module-containing protein [Aeromonas caviae]|uniref:retention module-containing protein n=2 Tax=Aeromonas caviae TaxID=648 RepID=UPI0029BFDFE8|nr:retention module-containing protein [Aeromonas caviae]